MPDFRAGDLVTTSIDGLRVRQRPGLSSNVVAGLLPLGAELQVVMGPIPTDDLGWYLVADADTADPEFGEGWIAAGFEPDAWLTSTGETAGETPYLASFAFTGDADNGPVEIGRGDHAIRWVAVDPEGTSCRFAVSLSRVPAIRCRRSAPRSATTWFPARSSRARSTRSASRGQAFVNVVSDCAWALVIERVVEPEPTASP